MNILKLMPKAELHIHLDGSVRPDTIISLAKEEGLMLPVIDPNELRPYLHASEQCSSLTEYLSKFQLPLQCLQSAESLRRVAYELVEDAHRDHVKYMEIRFAPLLHMEKGLTVEEIISHVLAGTDEAERKLGTTTRLIIICLRSHPVNKNLKVVHAASAFIGKGVVGMDLAGDEVSYPPEIHRKVFEQAHDYGLPITIHAGEAADANNIDESIRHLHAARIGHGVRLQDDAALMQWVKDHHIVLEMCPSSNVQTKAVESWSDHPIKEYFDQGIRVTVNTDNLTVSGTTLTKEYERLMEIHDFSTAQFAEMNLYALQASFLENPEKLRLLNYFREEYETMGLLPK
ncbi:adenosine deaminase [Paenibacillus zeisoli]|nr:adenosine deaminase [Paenibacillus zeisoli]